MAGSPNPDYQVYLLRLWRDPAGSPRKGSPWHCSMELVGTDQRRGFADVEELAAFLRARYADREDEGEPSSAATASVRGEAS
jgi:hypothetical protein